jgi:hypothetical protein
VGLRHAVRMPVPAEIPAGLLAGPFTLATARGLGVSQKVLRGRRFRRIFCGTYVSSDRPETLELRLDAARLLLPGEAAFSHHTAVALRRLPGPEHDCVHVTIPQGGIRPRIRGLVVHSGCVEDVALIAGRRVVRAERNFVELAGQLSLVELVVLGDAMVRRGWTTVEDLREAASRPWRIPGAHRARQAAELVLAHVDSPMETRTRLLLVFGGLPCPEPGREVLDEYGQWVARPDLQYRAQRIALEYDGDLHRTLKRKWRQDVATREHLRDLGWRVLVLTADDVFSRPEALLERVRSALVERHHPAVPRVIDPAWQRHFVVRRGWSDEW